MKIKCSSLFTYFINSMLIAKKCKETTTSLEYFLFYNKVHAYFTLREHGKFFSVNLPHLYLKMTLDIAFSWYFSFFCEFHIEMVNIFRTIKTTEELYTSIKKIANSWRSKIDLRTQFVCVFFSSWIMISWLWFQLHW